MLILPPGHAETVTVARRLRTREKWMVGGVLTIVAAVLVAVVIALSSGEPTSGNGCIHLTYAGPIGAQRIDQCGAPAQVLCRDLGSAGGFTGPAVPEVAAACRKAGLAVGH